MDYIDSDETRRLAISVTQMALAKKTILDIIHKLEEDTGLKVFLDYGEGKKLEIQLIME
jgi:hypothetical protein